MSLPVSSPRPRPTPRPRPAALPLEVVGSDLQVPLVTGGTTRQINLDYAASAPCLRVAHEAVAALLPWYSSVHRGAGFPSSVTTAALAAARAQLGRFVGARSDDAVVFTRNTTDALNLLAAALPDDTAVVCFASEHHANLLPWRRRQPHRCLPPPRSAAEAVRSAGAALSSLPARHRLLAVTGASNVTGELWPLPALVEVARRHRARVVVDAAQLAPHRRIDLAALGADFLALSGHKLYAPFGSGLLVGRRDWLDRARPYLAGGGATLRVTGEAVEWAEGPARHEAGTPNVPGAIALGAACAALQAVGMEAVAAHEGALLSGLLAGLARLPSVQVLSQLGEPRIGVVSLLARGWDAGALAAALAAEHGIGVRSGAFCAHPLLAALTDGPGGALRVSLGAGSSQADVDALLEALGRLLQDGPRWRYRRVEGRVVPDPDPRPLPALHPLLALDPAGPAGPPSIEPGSGETAACAGRAALPA